MEFRKDEPVEITGAVVTYDKDKNTYYAEEDVVVTQKDTMLKAKKVTVDMTMGIATAEGEAVLSDALGNYMKADVISVDMENETAVIVRGRIFFNENNIYLWGEEIRKTGRRSYSAEDVSITTCDCKEGEPHPWSFRSTSARLTLEGYLTAWNARFYLKGVPVFYSPFIAAPAKRERQTGLLTPKLGYSRLKGVKLDNAFFWAISDSTDSTFYFDIETKRGLGKGLEYRYYRKRHSFGEIHLYHFRERSIDRVREFRADEDNLSRPLSAENDRWQAKLAHREFAPSYALKADVNIVSDDEYFIDFGKTSGERAAESLESVVSISRSWASANLTAQARLFDNLLLEDDSTVLQRLPEIQFGATGRKIRGAPVFFSMNAAAVNFERDEGVEGQRLDARPRLVLPMTYRWLELSPSFSPRWTFYDIQNADADESRYIYEFELPFVATFIRDFKIKSGELRHTVRPKLSYVYVPPLNQGGFADFDEVDRVSPVNEIRYSLNSTLSSIVYLDIRQSYNIREARGDDREDPERKRPFTDIFAELAVRPAPSMNLSLKGRYDAYDGRFENSDGSFAFKEDRYDVSFSYRFAREELEYLEAGARWKATDAISAGFWSRYSLKDEENIERTFTVGYAHQCWGAELSYRQRPEETLILLDFSLKGLGEVLSTETAL
jgi:LPS-assembly protein